VQRLQLASLTASGRTASAGNFGVIIDEVEKMIQVLKDEETTDIDQRDWRKETTYQVEKIEAKITKLTETKEELEDPTAGFMERCGTFCRQRGLKE